MEFKCSLCDYTSPLKFCVNNHINKKNKCGENPSVITVNGNITCEYCNLVFKTRFTINKHYKVCKNRRESGELNNQRASHASSIININGNNNSNVNNNNTNITVAVPIPALVPTLIPLRPYFKPKIPDDIDDICEESWDKMKCIVTYIQRVFCNSEIPENHSMCITNLMAKLGTKVFNGDEWETLDTNKFISDIAVRTAGILDKWVSADKRRSKYRMAHDNYLNNENPTKLLQNIKDEITNIKLLLYKYSKSKEINIKSPLATPMPQYTDDDYD